MKNTILRGVVKGIVFFGVFVTSFFAGYGVESFCQDVIDNIGEN
jgi:hypothetical protein